MTITQLFTNKTKRPLLVASILSFFGFVFVACLIIIPITIHYQNANSFANKNYRIDGSNWSGARSGKLDYTIEDYYDTATKRTIQVANIKVNLSFSNYVAHNLIIPATVGDPKTKKKYPVKYIADEAFTNCIGVEGSITISDGVLAIGNNAFANCAKITSIILADSVNVIGDNAFYNCTNLRGSLTLSDNVKTVGKLAFSKAGFNNMLSLGKNITKIDDGAFSYTNFSQQLVLPIGLQYIGSSAFSYMSYLPHSNLIIPENVSYIGIDAFTNSTMGGKLIFVGDNTNPVLKIDSRAFYGCYSFEAIEINGFLRINDETIGSDAFGSWRYGGTISYVEQAGGILVGTNVLGYFNNAGLSGQDWIRLIE